MSEKTKAKRHIVLEITTTEEENLYWALKRQLRDEYSTLKGFFFKAVREKLERTPAAR